MQSMYLDQLKGKYVDNKTIKGSTCEPLTIDPDTQKAYYPCGLIANSMFNDTINSPWQVGSVNGEVEYTMTNKGIAWASDKEIIKKTQYKPWEVVPPQNWREKYPNGYTEHIPDLGENEEFMVWMRTAALPTFSKLARRNDTTALAPGNYRLSIQDRMSDHLSFDMLCAKAEYQDSLSPNTAARSGFSYLLALLLAAKIHSWGLPML